MKITPQAQARLAHFAMLVLDVDGVLTQGEIFYTDSGTESKAFDVKDGLGLRVAVGAGLHLALLTGRSSSVVQRRARDLRLPEVLQRVGDKGTALRELAEAKGLELRQVAYMGDDLNDLPALRLAGLSIAPADAVPDVLAEVGLITDAPGGRGAARQAVELILRAQDKWEAAVAQYLAEAAERDQPRRPKGENGPAAPAPTQAAPPDLRP